MHRWLTGEPRLEEMLSDPVIQLMMRRDGVDPDRLHAVLRQLGARAANVELAPSLYYQGETKSMGM